MDGVFRLAYSYLKSAAEADDVTQNALLKLYLTDKRFESEAHVKNWLYRVGRQRVQEGPALALAARGGHRGLRGSAGLHRAGAQ